MRFTNFSLFENQYYTPPVLNVYKQKTPLLGGAFAFNIDKLTNIDPQLFSRCFFQ